MGSWPVIIFLTDFSKFKRNGEKKVLYINILIFFKEILYLKFEFRTSFDTFETNEIIFHQLVDIVITTRY